MVSYKRNIAFFFKYMKGTMDNYLKVLGCRGSVPRSGKGFSKYGGATSSYALRLGGRLIIIDAGSGIMSVDRELREGEKSFDLFLTHPHADHILGLPMCRPVFDPGFGLRVYSKTRLGYGGKAQVNSFMSLPIWPVDVDGLAASFEFIELENGLVLEGEPEVKVYSMDAAHPGGCSLLRFEFDGKSVVVATDCTIREDNKARMLEFAKDCSLLLIDGQYRPVEFGGKAGFGHNSWTMAAEFGKHCGAARTLIVHHDPFNTDDVLDKAESDVRAVCASADLAYEEEIIEL